MELRKFLAILTLAVVILLLVLIWFSPSSGDFRTDNPSWDGVREMITGYSVSPVLSLSGLSASPQGSTLTLIPYHDFATTELERLNNFITQGGTLILADDYGHGNQVLEYLGLKARFSGQVLLDPIANYKNKWFPRISQFKPNPLTDNVSSLTFNHATCLTDVDADNVLALSSQFSFLDLNDNEVWDEGEPTGPLPVISQHSLGSGRIILIADPSLFINSMEVMADNNRFIQNIAAISPTLLIDQSHLSSSNLRDSTKNLLAQTRSSLVTPAGTFGLVILALAIVLRPIWRK